MLKSKALILGTIFFACFGIFAMFYGVFMTQIKLGDTSQYNFLSKDSSQWFKPKAKVVLVIVDALRFDYLLEHENIDHLEKLKLNKFKKFNQAFYTNPEQFVVFRSKSDVPTFTAMRVPCFMTGNVPEKAHIMTSFGALATAEDSIACQVKLTGKKEYFAGDPVLSQYFPEYLIPGTKTKGFDIRDDQVDDAPHEYILQKVIENDFDFMIAHLLMIDHTGHLHGVLGQKMLDAIANVDQFIMDLIYSIGDDTILIFAGDHGMTADGNHGGGEPQETNTAMVAYHKKGFMKYRSDVNHELKKVMRSVNETEAQIRQVDLVPTLAMLMGIPIPFSNMGQVLNDLYPNSDDLTSQSSFEMQMLHDNHLNTLQILNYFYKYQKQSHIADQQEMAKIEKLAQEVENAYKAAAAQEMTNEVAVNAILKSQELASEVYDLVNTKTPYEMTIFTQGFILLILVMFSYIFIIQFLYKTNDDDEHITWSGPGNIKSLIKLIAPVIVLIALICTVMRISDAKIMHPITVSIFILGLWIFGSSMLFFFFKRNASESFSLKALFLFQTPGITAAAVAIFGYLIYLVHAFNIDREKIDKLHYLNPYVIFLLAVYRLFGRYVNIAPYIMTLAGLFCVGLHFLINIQSFWSEKLNTAMGLLLLADWVFSEVFFAQKKLKTSNKAWNYQYLVGFGVLAVYHLMNNRESDLVQIFLPRIIWAISIGSCLMSRVYKMPRNVIKRNMQVYLVLFMALLQAPKRVLYFAMVLSAMQIVNFQFKRASFKNYLYPIIICFIGYIGLFTLNFTDRRFPGSFAPAFVGLRDFNIVFSILFYALAIMSTIFLGMLFLSYHNQDINLKEVKLGVVEEEEAILEACPLQERSEVIKIRNIILYGFFYNIIMISASIKIIVYRETKLDHEGVMEKFFVDAAFYIVIMIILYLMLSTFFR